MGLRKSKVHHVLPNGDKHLAICGDGKPDAHPPVQEIIDPILSPRAKGENRLVVSARSLNRPLVSDELGNVLYQPTVEEVRRTIDLEFVAGSRNRQECPHFQLKQL